jgi:hypothetical protein
MKKVLFLTLIAIATLKNGVAQEIKISRGGIDYTNGTIDAWFDIADYPGTSAFTFSGFIVKNTGSTAKSIRMIRQQVSVLQGTSNYFCWESCYSPNTDTSTGNVNLSPNGEFADMFLDYAPSGQLGTSTVRYLLQNVANLNDTASILVRYSATPTSLNEINAVPSLSAIYPNPASNQVTVNYNCIQVQSSIEIKNLLGQVQRILPIVAGSKNINISVADMPEGIYFVTLKSGGNIIDTKRLVVSR